MRATKRALILIISAPVLGLSAIPTPSAGASSQSEPTVTAAASAWCKLKQNGRSVRFTCYSSTKKKLHAEIFCKGPILASDHYSAYQERKRKSGTRKFKLGCPPFHSVQTPGWYFK